MKHITLDCYGSVQHSLDSMILINQLLTNLTYQVGLNPITPPHIIPYYYGKVKEDIGISGYVLLEGGHVTIHTFPMRECYFVDVFSTSDYDEKAIYKFFMENLPFNEKLSNFFIRNRAVQAFDVLPYDPNIDFGPHVMGEIKTQCDISMEQMFDFLEKIVVEINMDPIIRAVVVKNVTENPDYLSGIIIIAQSHISLHYEYATKRIYADLFSCVAFDYTVVDKYFEQLGQIVSSILVPRGTKHIYKVKSSVDNAELLANTKWQRVIKCK